MGWDGNGNFTRTNGTQSGATTWADNDDAGSGIEAVDHDLHDEDLADGIQACLTKNNETKPTADFRPNANNTYDLGSSSLRWAQLWLSGATNPIMMNALNSVADGRLTLTTAVPVTTAEVTAAETIYYTPYIGNRIALYDGTDWKVYFFTELSLDVPDVTGMHDVFIYDNAGTLTLEALVWTNDTTRATALVQQNGVYVKTGATTRRYLGSFYSTTAGNGQTEDSLAKRYLWNMYNRVHRNMRAVEATNSWTYLSATFRQANNSTANQLDMVRGLDVDACLVEVTGICARSGATGYGVVGIGTDSSTSNGAQRYFSTLLPNNALDCFMVTASRASMPGVGRHDLRWLEAGDGGAGTLDWFGDAPSTGIGQSGINTVVLA